MAAKAGPWVHPDERRKAAARAKALCEGRREAARWGELGHNAAVAPFAGPFGPIIVPNPKYFNDRKYDAGRATELARHVGAAWPWEASAGPIAHWTTYDAAADRYNPRFRQTGASAPPRQHARPHRQLPAVVRERLAALEAERIAQEDEQASGSYEEDGTPATIPALNLARLADRRGSLPLSAWAGDRQRPAPSTARSSAVGAEQDIAQSRTLRERAAGATAELARLASRVPRGR
ncbi:hypothetical protein T492DRAFT_937363 [Pavlovales sp. CCMP2436]|nr:hypothetical protein T492DRAFT_937363 [Pavlovales sp. CCMP2436]